MAKNTGGPAFPGTNQQRLQAAMRALMDAAKREDLDGVTAASQACADAIEPGMSLRDHFAGKALPAVMEEYFRGNGTCLGTEHAPRNCAAHAYAYADAMLAERAK